MTLVRVLLPSLGEYLASSGDGKTRKNIIYLLNHIK